MREGAKWGLILLGAALLLAFLFFITGPFGIRRSLKTPPKIAYHLTLHSPTKNQISVQGKISSQGTSEVSFWRHSATLELQDLQVYDHAGNKLEPAIQDWRVAIPTPKRGPVFFRYWVKTGPWGRHGHQGYLGENFGLFNGSQLFLIPDVKNGYPEVTVRISLPEGWDILTSWKRQGDIFVPWKSKALWPDSFAKSILAFGSFETRKEKIGETELSVSIQTGWPSSERRRIFENVSKVYRYLTELFGGSAGETYSIILTPPAEGGGGINADHWAFGVGTSLTHDKQRDWELIAHRIFHKFNSDSPLGMKPKRPLDGWFLEGAPSFYEHTAIFESGMTVEPSWEWEGARNYYSITHCAGRYLWNYFIEPQKSRIPLSEDYRIQDVKDLDFFHYTQAKLVTALFDQEIRRLTRGGKNLKDLLAFQYRRYREEKGSFDLLEDLKEVAGHDFAPFFEAYLYDTKLLPIWRLGEEYPWGDEEVILYTGVTTSFGGSDLAAIDRLVEEESISLPVTQEEAEGLSQLKGVPAWTIKAIKRTLLQLKVAGIDVNDPQKEEKLTSPENFRRWHQYLQKRKSQNSGTGL